MVALDLPDPGFTRLVAGVAEVREVTSPFPWTTIWASLPDWCRPGGAMAIVPP